MKFLEKMCLNIILKVTDLFKRYIFRKTTGGQIDLPPVVLGLKYSNEQLALKNMIQEDQIREKLKMK